MNKELLGQVHALVAQYGDSLSSAGITVAVSRKYFECDAQERAGSVRGGEHAIFHLIFRSIDQARDRKTEKQKGYHYERNKYYYIILSVLPTQKHLISQKDCKEYSFVLKKVSRAHIGLEPRLIIYEQDKILVKIEKRMQKIIRKAQKSGVVKACKNTWWDALRYFSSTRYEYKDKFCGRDKFFWEMLFAFLVGALAILIPLLISFFIHG